MLSFLYPTPKNHDIPEINTLDNAGFQEVCSHPSSLHRLPPTRWTTRERGGNFAAVSPVDDQTAPVSTLTFLVLVLGFPWAEGLLGAARVSEEDELGWEMRGIFNSNGFRFPSA